MDLHGNVSVVTGAGSGIGRELAVQAAGFGPVLCVGRRAALVRDTAARIRQQGGVGIHVAADVTRHAEVARAIETGLREFGRIDVVISAAGRFGSVGPIWAADPDDWWQDVTTNLRGTMLLCRVALPYLMAQGRGAIITMDGGGGAGAPNLGGSAYGASKAAIVRFTEGLARELEQVGSPVLAVCVNPGFVRSPLTERLAEAPRSWQAFVQELLARDDVRGPAEAAAQILRLVEVLSSELNGCTLDPTIDLDRLERLKVAIQADDLLTMRLRPLDQGVALQAGSHGTS